MLNISSLSKTYPGSVCALCHVSLEIHVGLFALLGSNGASKTRLMKTLATLLDAVEGTVMLDGIIKDQMATRQRRGYLPQDAIPEREADENREAADGVPAAPFALYLEISAPRDQTAISSRHLLEVRDAGERQTFVYETEQAESGLMIACAPDAERR